MIIAATYDNGQIFQHFGRTEAFKIYETDGEKILSSRVLYGDGIGHEALAGLLAQHGVQVLLCGGIGGGAMSALSQEGITVYGGLQGDPDLAVEALLRGELEEGGGSCDHHHGEEGGCGHHGEEGGCGHHGEEGGCGHHGEEAGCGGCHGGGCGGAEPIEGPNAGKICRVHYRGTFNDGTEFDSSYNRGEPLEFVCGAGMMIRGFDKAVADMKPGEVRDVHLTPEEAYGPVDPRAVFAVKISDLPGSEDLTVGQQVYLTNSMGRRFRVRVAEKTETDITFDGNHEMAGKELNFRIELVEVK